MDGFVKDMMNYFWFCGYSGGIRTVLNKMGRHKRLRCFGLELGINNIKLPLDF